MESMALIRYIKNSRNTETLIAGEFMFRKNKCRDEKVYWKCRKSGCNAKITTHNGKVVGYFLKHNHVDNNHDEIVRLEGLHSRNNQPQVREKTKRTNFFSIFPCFQIVNIFFLFFLPL